MPRVLSPAAEVAQIERDNQNWLAQCIPSHPHNAYVCSTEYITRSFIRRSLEKGDKKYVYIKQVHTHFPLNKSPQRFIRQINFFVNQNIYLLIHGPDY